MDEVSLGVYMFDEKCLVVPNLVKDEEQQDNQHSNELWKLYFDWSRSKNGASGGCMLVSPNDEKYYSSFRFTFSYTNNTIEYEALVDGLQWTRKRGISCLQVFGDSEWLLFLMVQ